MIKYTDISAFPVVDSLRLIRTENVGSVTFFELVQLYGSPAKALAVIPELTRRGGSRRVLTMPDLVSVRKEMDMLEKSGSRIIAYGAPEYPRLLTYIHDAPPLLFAMGNIHLLQRNCFGIVGSRNASLNARTLTRKLSADIGNKDYMVVSGLARGIDAEAHKAALASGTIAVIGGGIDTIYPPENADLYRLIAQSGVIVTEQPFGAAPTAISFPRRNRIISGISRGVLVVEASLKSGTLITARCAVDQGRDVFAVPGSPLDARSKGTNMLIKNGAYLVENADDILSVLQSGRQLHLSEPKHQEFEQLPQSNAMPNISESELASARAEIMNALGAHPVGLDEIVEATQIPSQIVRIIMLEMELSGAVERSSGSRFSLIYQA